MEPDFLTIGLLPAPRCPACLLFYFYSIRPLVNARDPLKSDFIPLKSSPCQLGASLKSHLTAPVLSSLLLFGWFFLTLDASFLGVLSDLPGGCLSSLPWSPPMGTHTTDGLCLSFPSPMSEMDQEETSTSAVICLLAIRR